MPRLFRSRAPHLPRPLVIAHRGASGVAPENTCAAISTAVKLGADMVEIDVQLSKDGHLVVFHDWTVRRTIRDTELSRRDRRQRHICDLTLEEITQFDAGSWWSAEFCGERVPTLADALALCGGQTALNIEVKPSRLASLADRRSRRTAAETARETSQIVERLGDTLAQHPHVDVVVSSFDHALLARLQRVIRPIKLGVLSTSRGLGAALSVAGMLKAYSVHVPCSAARRSLVETVHTAGLRVFVYTANRAVTMRRLLAVGVDGIFTDYPDRLRALVDR